MSNRLLEIFADSIERDDINLIKSMLSNREVDANCRVPREHHPPALVHAVHCGSVDVVELLLNAGARIDDVDVGGRSACHIAAMRGHAGMLPLLLPHRPNLALKEKYGQTALRIAIRMLFFNTGNAVALLVRAGSPLDHITGELCQVAASSVSAVQALLDRGVVVRDLRDFAGRTPLHLAVCLRWDDSALLSMLVDVCRVDLEARSNGDEPESCTDVAVSRGRIAALRRFLLAGANVNAPNSVGETMLHKSVVSRDIKCMMLLLAAGADVAARDHRGRSAWHLAALAQPKQMMSIVHALLAAGADADAVDENGISLHLLLAERRATINAARVETERRKIAKLRLDFVRRRALEVCIGLQSLRLDALQSCEILVHACGPLAPLIAFHQWWKLATRVKHFKKM
jgi:serine/threonine-protein phosphatase 6 regulatory ankyrin repeat subunit B